MSDSLSSPIIRLDADQSGTCQNMDIPNFMSENGPYVSFTPLVDMWSFFIQTVAVAKAPRMGRVTQRTM